MIPERSIEVLRAIVHDYIATREPVGSKSLVNRYQFGVSSATIRNDMALLEEEELIVSPHTSAGRVPTDKGYRLFVNRLNEVRPLTSAETQAIENFLNDSVDLDEVLGKTVRLLSKLTNQVAMVQYPLLGKAKIQNVELVAVAPTRVLLILVTDSGRIQQHVCDLPVALGQATINKLKTDLLAKLFSLELAQVAVALGTLETGFEAAERIAISKIKLDLLELVDANRQNKIILSGTANLVRSESDFGQGITPVLEAIEQQVVLLKLMAELEAEQHGVSVSIGRENQVDTLSSAALVVAGYDNQGSEVAKLGVIGPTRMDYSSNMSAVSAVARYLSKTLG